MGPKVVKDDIRPERDFAVAVEEEFGFITREKDKTSSEDDTEEDD